MARVLISMPESFLGKIDEVADLESRSRSELIREALRSYITRSQVRKSDASFPYGFRTLGNDIFFDFTVPNGTIVIEYLKMPKPFTFEDFENRELILGDEYLEIYIYHILSREALLFDDIERLNNYSAIYSAQLKALSRSLYGGCGCFRFSNIW